MNFKCSFLFISYIFICNCTSSPELDRNSIYDSGSDSFEAAIVFSGQSITPDGNVFVSWSDPSKMEIGSLVQKSLGDDSSFVDFEFLEANDTNILDESKELNTKLYYRVLPYSMISQTTKNDRRFGNTYQVNFGRLQFLSRLNSPANRISFGWENDFNFSDFMLIQANYEKKGWVNLDSLTNPLNQYDFETSGIGYNLDFRVQVGIINQLGEEDIFSTVLLEDNQINIPTRFRLIRIINERDIQLEWQKNSAFSESYNVFQRSKRSSVERNFLERVGIGLIENTSNSIISINSTTDDRYRIEFQAFNSNLNILSEVIDTGIEITIDPTPPEIGSHISLSPNSIQLSTSSISEELVEVNVYQKEGEEEFNLVETVSPLERNIEISGLDEALKYTFRLRSYSSDYSDNYSIQFINGEWRNTN